MTRAQFCLIYGHETTEEPSSNSGFFPLSLFSWCLQELPAGRAQDSVTSQNFALGSPRSVPSTLTRSMGLPVMGERLTATVGCASPTGTSVCSSGGLVSTACSRTCCPFSQLYSSPCARQEYLPYLLSAARSEPFLLPYPHGRGSKKFPVLQPFQKKHK